MTILRQPRSLFRLGIVNPHLAITIIYKQVVSNLNKINMLNEKIIKICEQKFIYLNYSKRTSDNYLSHIKRFISSIGDKQIIHLNSKDFQ